MSSPYPVLINCRDRLAPLRSLVAWLERHGHDRIILVDNDSTYAPLLEYYDRTPHHVVRLDQNLGHLAPWQCGAIDELTGDDYYIETDCDVVPDPSCPGDAFDLLRAVLDDYPEYCKVGLGLRIDNLPWSYRHRRAVLRWESQFWDAPLPDVTSGRPALYEAPIDTTLAMYRPRSPATLDKAIRTGPPYVGRHEPWYANSYLLSPEDRYYRKHARTDIASWNVGRLPERIRVLVDSRPKSSGRRAAQRPR